MFDTRSDVVLQAVLTASLALIAMALAVLASTVWLRYRHERRERHRAEVHRLWRPILFSHSTGDMVELPTLPTRDTQPFVELWLSLMQQLRGDARAPLKSLALKLELPTLMRKWLERGFVDRQLTAITALGYLQDEESQDAILELLDDPRTVFSLCAARALVNINPDKAIGPISDHLYRPDWSTGRLASLLKDVPAERRRPLLRKAIEAADEFQTQRLLRLMNALNPGGYDDAIEWALSRFPEAREVLIAALNGMHSRRWLDTVRNAAGSDSWAVRTQATRALGRLGTPTDLPLLDQLMQDSSWWVRRRAAEAIASLPGITSNDLDRRLASLTDAFARDALVDARQRLAAGGTTDA